MSKDLAAAAADDEMADAAEQLRRSIDRIRAALDTIDPAQPHDLATGRAIGTVEAQLANMVEAHTTARVARRLGRVARGLGLARLAEGGR